MKDPTPPLVGLVVACGLFATAACDRRPSGGTPPAATTSPAPRAGHGVEAEVVRIISEQMGVRQTDLKPGTDLVRDLKADELDQVELVMELEDEFEISIPDEDFEKLKTVGDVTAYVEARRKDPSARQRPPADRVC